jgi:hypothetical protein
MNNPWYKFWDDVWNLAGYLLAAAFFIFILVRFILWIVRGSTVACPRCAERVKANAAMCRFCGLTFQEPEPDSATHRRRFMEPVDDGTGDRE